ncbi:helix-turn-helix domain-containing protein [Streptomyces sp. 5-8]|uniref:Helix-turn-helix domain-containing protein n=1 Tax=Streptomyces musisoli TaxID=2802280 RepID=A0ABS1NW81_9ACTN|nr:MULTISPECIES: helix-turn-helix domain-containing protein [Streptomyces]MBL1104359.1 helix-turn-helix domain-containing protein [Streptomyces musisoli]MBY8840332.1 helix-turn-helix domain-containing protein [Streptomyces sp. SP2-10]
MRSTTVLPGTPTLPPPPGDVPLHRLEIAGPGAAPFAAGSFEAVGPLSRWDRPHRHTFYEIVHVSAGSGTHVVDLARWPLRPPHLAVVLPGQVHHWEGGQGPEGTLVLFTDDFLVDHPGDREVLRRLGEQCWFGLDAAHDRSVRHLMAELVAEHRQRAPGHESVLRSLLHVLVVRASRLPGPGGTGRDPRAQGRPAAVAEAFTRLISRPEAAGWSVRECADRLGVTPHYLTQAVRTATGRPPGRLLIEARAYQAQRLLAHTQLSVRQVAARTGFADPAYFSRFFRRETGSSPGDFRKHHSRPHESLEAPPTPA